MTPHRCTICGTTHTFDDRCSPEDVARVAEARRVAYAEVTAAVVAANVDRVRRPYRHDFSYAAEIACNDPWWTDNE